MKILKFNEHVDGYAPREYIHTFTGTSEYIKLSNKYLKSSKEDLKEEYLIGLVDESFKVFMGGEWMSRDNIIISANIGKRYKNMFGPKMKKTIDNYHRIFTEMGNDINEVKTSFEIIGEGSGYEVKVTNIEYNISGKIDENIELDIEVRFIKPHNIQEVKDAHDRDWETLTS